MSCEVSGEKNGGGVRAAWRGGVMACAICVAAAWCEEPP